MVLEGPVPSLDHGWAEISAILNEALLPPPANLNHKHAATSSKASHSFSRLYNIVYHLCSAPPASDNPPVPNLLYSRIFALFHQHAFALASLFLASAPDSAHRPHSFSPATENSGLKNRCPAENNKKNNSNSNSNNANTSSCPCYHIDHDNTQVLERKKKILDLHHFPTSHSVPTIHVFLDNYTRFWTAYCSAAKTAAAIASYLDRTYIAEIRHELAATHAVHLESGKDALGGTNPYSQNLSTTDIYASSSQQQQQQPSSSSSSFSSSSMFRSPNAAAPAASSSSSSSSRRGGNNDPGENPLRPPPSAGSDFAITNRHYSAMAYSDFSRTLNPASSFRSGWVYASSALSAIDAPELTLDGKGIPGGMNMGMDMGIDMGMELRMAVGQSSSSSTSDIMPIADVYGTALIIWREVVLKKIEAPLRDALIAALHQSRRQFSRPLTRKNDNQQIQNNNTSLMAVPTIIQSIISVQKIPTLGASYAYYQRTFNLWYTNIFEKSYLDDVAKHFQREALAILSNESTTNYIRLLHSDLLRYELERGKDFLHESTFPKLASVLDKVLISDHLDVILKEINILLRSVQDFICATFVKDGTLEVNEAQILDPKNLCDSQKIILQDLKIAYTIVSKIETGLKPVQETLKSYVESTGIKALEPFKNSWQTTHLPELESLQNLSLSKSLSLHPNHLPPPAEASASTSTTDKIAATNPIIEHCVRPSVILEKENLPDYHTSRMLAEQKQIESFVQTCWKVYDTYSNLVDIAFDNNTGLTLALDQGCTRFLNSFSTAPSVLARFCHLTLDKSHIGNTSDKAIEARLEKVTRIFRYLDEKDLFQKYYSLKLGQRLIFTTSVSFEAEQFMLNRLRESCGLEYVSRLVRMFKDITISQNENVAYQKWLKKDSADKSLRINWKLCTVQILASGSWPFVEADLKTSPATALSTQAFSKLPEFITTFGANFSNYYTERHSGRKLFWVHELSKIELSASIFQRQLTIRTSLHQAAVLLCFNDDISVPMLTIARKAGLSLDQTKTIVKIIAQTKLLRVVEDENMAELSNPRGKNNVLNLNLLTETYENSEEKTEGYLSRKALDEDRKLQIQAALVRIMKHSGKLKHEILVSKCVEMLTALFIPTVSDIKRNIDILIEKEYLSRSESDRNTYIYTA